METQTCFEFLCRVCAANTKGKQSVAECVYILKTSGLKDKIERHLYLPINDHDALPKVLCKTCFRQVEATASLSKIARHTQKVFRDYLFSAAKTKTSQKDEVASHHQPPPPLSGGGGEFTPIFLKGGTATTRPVPALPPLAVAPPPTIAAATGGRPSSPPPLVAVGGGPRRDEVVVNVSVADPLTRETQEKMILASQRKQQQHHHASSDTNFTPKSIAQRGFSRSPKRGETNVDGHNGHATPQTGGGGARKSSPAGVISFVNGQPQAVSTTSCGGIGVGANNPCNFVTVPTAAATASESGGIRACAQSIKRRSLKRAIKNIRPANVGQESLLKVSQTKHQLQVEQASAQIKGARLEQTLRQIYGNAVANVAVPERRNSRPHNHTLFDGAEAGLAGEEEVLPQRIIIAAAKNKKREREMRRDAHRQQQPAGRSSGASSSQSPPRLVRIRAAGGSPDRVAATPTAAPHLRPDASLPEDILLGRVIKDVDLLKLILKALRWPVTQQTMSLQMARLRSSRFADIMSDSNLLQDTDLTQLLGPYLAPVMMAAQLIQQQQSQQQLHPEQQQQQQQQMAAPATPAKAAHQQQQQQRHNQKGQASLKQQHQQPPQPAAAAQLTEEALSSTIPYKLPPETSVQLVPASPPQSGDAEAARDDVGYVSPPVLSIVKEGPSAHSLKRVQIAADRAFQQKKKTFVVLAPDTIVVSDEEEQAEDQPHRPAAVQEQGEPTVVIPSISPKVSNSISSPDMMPNFEIELDPAFVTQCGNLFSGVGENANEALLALLQRQRAALSRQQIQRRNRSRRQSMGNFLSAGAAEAAHLDDIVLMEQQGGGEHVGATTTRDVGAAENTPSSVAGQAMPAPATSAKKSSKSSFTVSLEGAITARRYSTAATSSYTHAGSGVLTPPDRTSATTTPAVTRPIIKRRKTVIQTSPVRVQVNLKKSASAALLTANTAEPALEEGSGVGTTTNHATQIPSGVLHVATQIPSTASFNGDTPTTKSTLTTPSPHMVSVSTSSSVLIAPSTSATGLRTYSKRLSTSKSALGQQLLEAIGLQKVPPAGSNGGGGGNPDLSADGDADSVQQIRSALKRQLKRAQEQCQQTEGDAQPAVATSASSRRVAVIQDADSTTKGINTLKQVHSDADEELMSVVTTTGGADSKTAAESPPPERRRKLLASVNARNRRAVVQDGVAADDEDEDNAAASVVLSSIEESKEDSETTLERADHKAREAHTTKMIEHQSGILKTHRASSTDTKESSTSPQRKSVRIRIDDPELRKATTDSKDKEADRKDVSRLSTRPIRDRSSDKRIRSVGSGDTSRDNEAIKPTTEVKSNSRPARISKTLSKYYKGPDEPTTATSTSSTATTTSTASRRAIPIRLTRLK